MNEKLMIAAAALLMLGASAMFINRAKIEMPFTNVAFSMPQISTNITNSIYLMDVDFDGQDDILFARGDGLLQAQEPLTYSCYLNRGDSYERCESFAAIPNPSVDIQSQTIGSVTREASGISTWSKYSYEDGTFVMTDRLTIYPQYNEQDIIWSYCEEVRAGNDAEAMKQVRKLSMANVSDLADISEQILADDGIWAVDSDKWKPLGNSVRECLEAQNNVSGLADSGTEAGGLLQPVF